MSGLCYERPGIEFPTRRLAMDAALPDSATSNASKPRIDDDAFKQILEALKDQLDPQNFGKVRDTLDKFTAMAMDAAIRSRSYAARFPEAERLGNAALAFDRSTNSYARMFPEAARLS